MDFSAWSPSHTLLLLVTLLAIGAQLVAVLTSLTINRTSGIKPVWSTTRKRNLTLSNPSLAKRFKMSVRNSDSRFKVSMTNA